MPTLDIGNPSDFLTSGLWWHMATLNPAQRSERLKRVRGRDTKPVLLVRRLAHSMGYRFTLHRRDLPGNPDLVFPSRMKAIQLNGCFWHEHPDPKCPRARLPKSNLDFWGPKLETNRKCDERNLASLAALGCSTLVIWECETENREDRTARIKEFLG